MRINLLFLSRGKLITEKSAVTGGERAGGPGTTTFFPFVRKAL
jgi:hypothetical protein